jgi:hypothetical protein
MNRYYVVERRLYPQCRSCMKDQARAARRYQSRGIYVRGYRLIRAGACFSPDTLVTTKYGKKPIRDLKVGDEVLAYDEARGHTGFYPVTAVLRHNSDMIEHLVVEGERITTTPEHPFYSRERGWVAAGDLYEGEAIRKGDGSYGKVESITRIDSRQTVFNLTVATAHTYFVGEGQWLVHNYKRLYSWR